MFGMGKLLVIALGAILLLAAVAQAEDRPDTTQTLVKKDFLDTHTTNITGYPYLYYTPETQLAFGVGGIATFYTSEKRELKPSQLTLSGYYTSNKQYKFSLGTSVYFLENRYLASGNFYYGFFVNKFWGVGNESPDTDDENYTTNTGSAFLNLQIPSLFAESVSRKLGFIVDIENDYIVDKKTNPFLLANTVTGSNGGWTLGLGANFTSDTRDQIFYPNHGGLYELQVIYYMKAIGSDYDFNRYTVDLRRYMGLGHEDQVLAIQMFADISAGDAPFYRLPALGGGQLMRGYFTGRYRDVHYLAGQVEYRARFWGRLGGVVFGGLGDVGRDDKPMSINTMKYSAGFGLRFVFNQDENVNLRADFGFGKDSSGVYFGLSEAF